MSDWMKNVSPGRPAAALRVDPETPSVARMYDYFLGGKDNFAADRRAADEVRKVLPNVATVAQSNRRFLQRAVRFAANRGIDQFLDLGAGLPTQGNVHEVAQSVRPDARVVYVDNDPVVISHGHALLTADDRTAIVQADMRDPASVLDDPQVGRLIDFGRPVAVLFVAVLHFVPDDGDPAGLVRRFLDATPAGSHIVLSHAAVEEQRNLDVGDTYKAANTNAPFTARTREQVTSFLDTLEIVEPGVVPLHEWRPEAIEPPVYAGWTAVGHKER